MGLTRRNTLQAGLASLLLGSAPALATRTIELPRGALVLRRRVQRNLSDGASIVVSREWLVEFQRRDDLIVVDGRQTAVDVSAPDNLASLAAMERDRDDHSLFPIMLSTAGLIIGGGRKEPLDPMAAAISAARAILQRTKDSMEVHRRNLAAIAAGGAALLDTIPRDLLYPEGGEQILRESIPLPDGTKGVFEQRYRATANPGGGWLDQAERLVATIVADTTSTSSENWDLKTAI